MWLMATVLESAELEQCHCHRKLCRTALDSLYDFSTQRERQRSSKLTTPVARKTRDSQTHPCFLPHNVLWTPAPRGGHGTLAWAVLIPLPPPWAGACISSLRVWLWRSRCISCDSSSQETRYIWDRRGHNPMSILRISSPRVWTPLSWM